MGAFEEMAAGTTKPRSRGRQSSRRGLTISSETRAGEKAQVLGAVAAADR